MRGVRNLALAATQNFVLAGNGDSSRYPVDGEVKKRLIAGIECYLRF